MTIQPHKKINHGESQNKIDRAQQDVKRPFTTNLAVLLGPQIINITLLSDTQKAHLKWQSLHYHLWIMLDQRSDELLCRNSNMETSLQVLICRFLKPSLHPTHKNIHVIFPGGKVDKTERRNNSSGRSCRKCPSAHKILTKKLARRLSQAAWWCTASSSKPHAHAYTSARKEEAVQIEWAS